MATIYAKGGRKSSVSRVYLTPIKEETTKIFFNKKPVEEYFSLDSNIFTVHQPLEALKKAEGIDSAQNFHIQVFVRGGGITGQAEAGRCGIAHAFAQIDENHKKIMRKSGFMTRDSRRVEPKKPGRRKARKVKQWNKR